MSRNRLTGDALTCNVMPVAAGTFQEGLTDDYLFVPAGVAAGAHIVNLNGTLAVQPVPGDGDQIAIGDPLGLLGPGTTLQVVGKIGGVGAQIANGTALANSIFITQGETFLFTFSLALNAWTTTDAVGAADLAKLAGLSGQNVANLAALSLVNDLAEPDQAKRNVQTLYQYFMLDKTSAATVDGITVVATLSGVGRWIRILSPAPHWQKQTAWFKRASGNDEGAGTSIDPIKTVAEFCRRLSLMSAPPTSAGGTSYTLDTDAVAVTDAFRPSFLVDPTQPSTNNLFEVAVNGTRTVFFTGVIGAGGVVGTAGNVQSAFDGGVGFVPATNLGKMIVITSGPAIGAFAWITKDLGGTSAQISDFYINTGAPSYTASLVTVLPLAGATFTTVDMTTFDGGFMSLGATPARFRFVDLDFTVTNGTLNAVQARDCSLSFSTCKIERTLFQSAAGSLMSMIMQGCGVYFAALTEIQCFGGTQLFQGCGMLKADLRCVGAGVLNLTDTHIEAGALKTFLTANSAGWVSSGPTSFLGGQINVSGVKGFGILDAPAIALTMSQSAKAKIAGPLYGGGNTGVGLNISEGAWMQVLSSVTPTLTGSADMAVDGGAIIPVITGGTGVPAAGAALVAWTGGGGYTDAATYNRNAHNLVNGTRITKYT